MHAIHIYVGRPSGKPIHTLADTAWIWMGSVKALGFVGLDTI